MIIAKQATLKENSFLDYCNQAFLGEAVIVPVADKKNVVILSEESFKVLEKAQRNAEYIAKLNRADEDLKAGRVIVKTIGELEAMAAQ